jgi:hypothetical protein
MRKLPLLIALSALTSVSASAQQRRFSLIVSESEPLPNCTPGGPNIQMPLVWDITAASFKFCSGTNSWSILAGGGGGGGGPIVQTNGVTNVTQTTLNFQNSGVFSWTNPSGGNEQVNFSTQSANCFIAAPNGIGGIPTCRLMVAGDVPAGTTCSTHFYATGLLAGLIPVCVQPSFSDLLGTIALGQTALTTNGDLLSVTGGALARIASAGGQDFLLQGANAAVPVWLAVNNCGSGNQALSYSTGTHSFGCQTITVGSGTINSSAQYSGVYYSAAGTTNTLSGIAAPTTPSVPFLWCSTPSGGVATAPAWCEPGVPINAQTAASYTVLNVDRENVDTMSNSGAVSVTLPQAGSAGFTNNFNFALANINTGLVTITPTTSTINGNATQIVPNHWLSYIYSDNVNYRAVTLPDIAAFPSCSSTTSALQFNSATGAFTCNTGVGLDTAGTTIQLRDEFIAHLPNTTGEVGDLGWNLGASGSATNAQIAGVYPHVGINQLASGATASSLIDIRLSSAANIGSIGAVGGNTGWTMTFIFKLGQTTNNRTYIGTSDAANGVSQIANGFYLRYDTNAGIADAAFKVVTCAASTCTTGGTTYTVDTNWHLLSITCLVSGQITFTLDANAPQTLTTNVATSTQVYPFITEGNDVTASNSFLNVDLFSFVATGLTRFP